MTDKEREELAEVIGKGLASGSKISAEDLQNENTISYKMGEIMEMDADFVTLLNFVDWYSPTKEVNEKLTKMLRHIAGQTYQNQTKVADLEKENAELKGLKDVATLIRANNDTVVTLMQLNNKLVSKSQQLTKAKEIIKELMSFSVQLCDCRHTVDFEKTREEAEQFLNSEVEK